MVERAKEEEIESVRGSFLSSFQCIFTHADGVDRLLMAVGFLGCVGDGLSTPLMFLISGMTVNSIAGASPNFTDKVAGNAVKLLYLAASSFIAAFLVIFHAGVLLDEDGPAAGIEDEATLSGGCSPARCHLLRPQGRI
ncbi:ABC transporter B family member 15 [Apostasia shenzhenica]|uniref:ABC transporter B family member 15 n=1 Tax=Apostasia shenzhenica TaxID=1088818 RepID=A0A2I0B706_9ASPA|nr:ABC transporter B family member 15 [Apostasia shenzhenica]